MAAKEEVACSKFDELARAIIGVELLDESEEYEFNGVSNEVLRVEVG